MILWHLFWEFWFLHLCASDQNVKDVRQMFADKGYTKMMRPVLNYSTSLQLSLDVVFQSIDELDLRKQLLSSSAWVTMIWQSDIYTWRPEFHGNVMEIYLTPEETWTPDTGIYNSADRTPLFATIKTPIQLNHKGLFRWTTLARFTTACVIDVRYYPFDEQKCDVDFGFWNAARREVNLSLNGDHFVFKSDKMFRNSQFNILNITAARYDRFFPSLGDHFPRIEFTIHLQRRTLFYIRTLLTPAILLGTLGFMTFFLPASCGERMGYSITMLLSMMVLLEMVAGQIPDTSDDIPVIAHFLEVILGSLTAAMVGSIITLRFLHQDTKQLKNIGWFVRVFTNKWLASLTLVKETNEIRVECSTHESTNAARKINEEELCKAEYRKAAKVWDRTFLCIYFIAVCGEFAWMTLTVPEYMTA